MSINQPSSNLRDPREKNDNLTTISFRLLPLVCNKMKHTNEPSWTIFWVAFSSISLHSCYFFPAVFTTSSSPRPCDSNGRRILRFDGVDDDIAYDLKQSIGNFLLMEGNWRVSWARSLLEFEEEKDAVLMCHFWWKSVTLQEI